MNQPLRAGDTRDSQSYGRTERFIEKSDGVYIKTREGLDGPHKDLAAALTGLMKIAEKSRLSHYQTRMLYESICEKALHSCGDGKCLQMQKRKPDKSRAQI